MKIYLNERGAEHNHEKGWYVEFGDEGEALFKGYNILNKEEKLN